MKMIGVEPLCHYRRSKSMAICAIIDLNGILSFLLFRQTIPFQFSESNRWKSGINYTPLRQR